MTGFGAAQDETGLYKPLKRDWRGYVEASANKIGLGAISNSGYFSADLQERVKYEFANRVDYSFLQVNISRTNYINSYDKKAYARN